MPNNCHFRGSLRACILRAGNLWTEDPHCDLAVAHNARGKYYVLMPSHKTHDYLSRAIAADYRLILNCSLHELRQIQNPGQQQALILQPANDPTPNI